MKKWLIGASLSCALLMGMSTGYADNLVLPKGETLDLGKQVSVWKGSQSFMGGYIAEFLDNPNVNEELEKNIVKAGIFDASDKASPKELASIVGTALKDCRLYQVRADADDTLYTGLVISVPVTNDQMTGIMKLMGAAKKPADGSKQDVTEKVMSDAMNKWSQMVTVGEHSSWKKGTTKSGVPYAMAHANLVMNQGGFLLPVYVGGFTLTRDYGMTYNVIIADQTSGNYLEPVIEKAVMGMAK